jgi:hypothetical protein
LDNIDFSGILRSDPDIVNTVNAEVGIIVGNVEDVAEKPLVGFDKPLLNAGLEW